MPFPPVFSSPAVPFRPFMTIAESFFVAAGLVGAYSRSTRNRPSPLCVHAALFYFSCSAYQHLPDQQLSSQNPKLWATIGATETFFLSFCVTFWTTRPGHLVPRHTHPNPPPDAGVKSFHWGPSIVFSTCTRFHDGFSWRENWYEGIVPLHQTIISKQGLLFHSSPSWTQGGESGPPPSTGIALND